MTYHCHWLSWRRKSLDNNDLVVRSPWNQPHLLEDIEACLEKALANDLEGVCADTYETEERGHGRYEKRSYVIVTNPEGIRDQEAWAELKVIGMCASERIVKGELEDEIRYFIGSREASARVYGQAFRGHWGIENGLHWQMDI